MEEDGEVISTVVGSVGRIPETNERASLPDAEYTAQSIRTNPPAVAVGGRAPARRILFARVGPPLARPVQPVRRRLSRSQIRIGVVRDVRHLDRRPGRPACR